jgi:hypothetical protein
MACFTSNNLFLEIDSEKEEWLQTMVIFMMESKQAVHITATVSTNGNQEKLMMANGKTARNTEKENG